MPTVADKTDDAPAQARHAEAGGPDSAVEPVERRRHERIQIYLRVRWEGLFGCYDGTLSDISAGGCFILSEKQGAIEGNVAWAYGNLATALFFAVPLSQILAKLFGRIAGPAKHHLAHILLNATAYFFSFGIMAVLLFALSEPLLRAFGGHTAN